MLNDKNMHDHEKILAVPAIFVVNCPDCMDTHEVEFQEHKDGGFEPESSECFIECECGKLIEAIGRWRNIP